MTVTTIALTLGGLALLIVGAELVVRGASRLAAAAGISPLVIGLTVVAFGTSSPELAVSLKAAWTGQADLAVGNIVGSNIFNVLVILGLAAAITPLVVADQLIRRDAPLMLGISLAMLLLALDGRIGRLDGALLTAGIVAYTSWAVIESRREAAGGHHVYAETLGERWSARSELAMNVVVALAGLGLLVLGARWLVAGAVAIATAAGISQLVIGLTIVAAGTSMPEVATSVVAALRGERDIAVGNAVGSNISNILGVLGPTALLSPTPIAVSPAALVFDIPVMIAVAALCLPVFFTGSRIARGEGLLFLGYYVAYTAYLVLTARQHDSLHGFSLVMAVFVIPATVLALGVLVLREVRIRRDGKTDGRR